VSHRNIMGHKLGGRNPGTDGAEAVFADDSAGDLRERSGYVKSSALKSSFPTCPLSVSSAPQFASPSRAAPPRRRIRLRFPARVANQMIRQGSSQRRRGCPIRCCRSYAPTSALSPFSARSTSDSN